ncbi:MAG: dihydroorotate dehydrogenase electron transfer subunit [Desulfitobacteriaceae bacterium]|nr:dihydroorotate dehydrogenase electron transfer subunit [Desulfitobacteriaceae bacterium]MDD4346398.1 dihydroorotate dehydrogenase electron transfer subunit [Desulfitobacteriaceae bacterium]MDD4401670.1 dihydroorotate dehydrogenase electron transfer subunit [Desulfitobacteriaceae bacterium]
MLADQEVIINEVLGTVDLGIRKMVLRGPIALEAKPGQFVHIQVRPGLDPLLRRPFSITAIDPERQEITLLYKIKGKGTELLSKVCPGQMLNSLGPLGKGFSLPKRGDLWLVAGGIGVFPLYALAVAAIKQGLAVRLFWGGESYSLLECSGLAMWKELELPVHISTIDGSYGQKCLVTDILDDYLQKYSQGDLGLGPATTGKPVQVAVCGPKGMMQAVTELCLETGLPVEVSLEEHMACGLGACLGCVVTMKDQQGKVRRAKVCQDGPVFRGKEVVWDVSY